MIILRFFIILGKRKKNKKKNSSACPTNAEETQQKSEIHSQASPDKNAMRPEEIIDRGKLSLKLK